MTKLPLAEQAFLELKQAIVNNQFTPGEKLNITELKKTYGFGLCPLREALARLAEISLLESECMKGYRVPKLSAKHLKDIYASRLYIDKRILELTIENADSDDEIAVVAAHHQLKKLEDDIESEPDFFDWQEKHKAFIEALMAGCHSPTMLMIHNILYEQTERYRSLWFQYSHSKQHLTLKKHRKDHQGFYDAFINRDKEKLITTYEQKIQRWSEEMLQCVLKQ